MAIRRAGTLRTFMVMPSTCTNENIPNAGRRSGAFERGKHGRTIILTKGFEKRLHEICAARLTDTATDAAIAAAAQNLETFHSS